MSGGGGDRCLLDTAVVKSASGPVEGDVVAGVSLAVRVKKKRCVHFAVQAKGGDAGFMEDVTDILGGA